jgi:hypothetical protein
VPYKVMPYAGGLYLTSGSVPMNRCRIALVMGVCIAVVGLTAKPAVSQNASDDRTAAQESVSRIAAAPAARTQPVRKEAKPYFIEFRARAAQSYGHTFAVHGRVGQKITAGQVVGLHPATESPIPWMIGHLVLVPSETGASDGDIEDQYIIARYRILLTAAEYKRVTAYMKELQASSPVWHAVLYNCNAFVGDIAKFMSLKTPGSTLLMPKDYIDELRELNTGTAQSVTQRGNRVVQ